MIAEALTSSVLDADGAKIGADVDNLLAPIFGQPYHEELLDAPKVAPLAAPDPVYPVIKSVPDSPNIHVLPVEEPVTTNQGGPQQPAGGKVLPFTGQIIKPPSLPATEPTAPVAAPSKATVAAGGVNGDRITIAGREFDRRDVMIAAAAIAAVWLLA